MERVVRVLIYEGEDDWLTMTLGKSLPQGRHNFRDGTIKVVPMPEMSTTLRMPVSIQGPIKDSWVVKED